MSFLEQRRGSPAASAHERRRLTFPFQRFLRTSTSHWPLVWALFYLAGMGLGGRLPIVLPARFQDRSCQISSAAARTAALLPALLAFVPGNAVGPLWLGVLAGGYASGSLEAAGRQARVPALAATPSAVAVPVVWTGSAILRITGWPTGSGPGRWRSCARILELGPAAVRTGRPDPAPGQGVMLAGRGQAPFPGEIVTGALDLFPPRGAALPGAFDYRLFLAGRGISWRGRFQDWKTIGCGDLPARLGRNVLQPLRRGLVRELDRILPPPEARMAGAVLLGIRTRDSRRASRPFADLGLAHLFAVSGLHVGILLGILMIPARWAGFSPWFKVAPLLVLLPVYVLLTGMPGSVVRAASLGFFILMAGALGRPAQSLRLIGLLFWAGTIWDPVQDLDMGLKLSYLAAGGILAVSSLTGGLVFSRGRWLGPVLTGLAVSFAAQWFTLPLVAGSFGRISLLSPLANLVAVPLFGLAVWCVVLSLVSAAVWPYASQAAAALGWLLLRTMSGLAGLISETSAGFPLGLPPPSLGRLAVWVLLSAGGLLVLDRFRRGRIPGRVALAAVFLVIGSGLCLFGPLAWTLRSPRQMTAWQFDVDQGDCGLVVFPDGWTLLIDTAGRYGFHGEGNDGPLKRTVLPFLRRNGCTGIDAVVLTHGHLDHTGGARALADGLPVRGWYVSGHAARALAGAVDSSRIRHPRAGLVLHRWRQWEASLVYPPGPLPSDFTENNRSLAVVLRRRGRDMALWSGDMELAGEHLMLESGRAPGSVQVWKAGHHGSNTSGSRKLLERLDPSLVLISCGVGNGYGHPSHGPYVVGADTVGIARTDLQGSIHMQWDRVGRLTWRTMTTGPRRISPP